MNILFLVPFVAIAVIGVMSVASIFDFRQRPLHGSMQSPFESDRTVGAIGPGRPLAELIRAWTREIHRDDVEVGAPVVLGDAACASCAISRDEEFAPAFGGEELEQVKARGIERPVGRV